MASSKNGMSVSDDRDGNASYLQLDKGARGTTVRTPFGRDDSAMSLPDQMGCKVGGGINNVAHSLKGATGVQGGNATKDYTKKL